MTETEFLNLIEKVFSQIEIAIEKIDPEIDCENTGGVLKLIFPNGTQVILNKQTPLFQLWLAGKSQGYHFDYKDGAWICNRSGKDFTTIFNEVCSEAYSQPITVIASSRSNLDFQE